MSKKIIFGGVIILAAVGLMIFGKANNAPSQVSNAVSSVHGGVSISDTKKNDAPDFTLEKLGGGTITLSDFKGKKPVVLDFWASWCPNCRRDMPNLNRYYEKYKDSVEVIGVNLQESPDTVEKFIASRSIAFPIVFDPRGVASRAFGIQYTNTHFLIDKEGNLVRAIPGDIRESDIVSLIESQS